MLFLRMGQLVNYNLVIFRLFGSSSKQSNYLLTLSIFYHKIFNIFQEEQGEEARIK